MDLTWLATGSMLPTVANRKRNKAVTIRLTDDEYDWLVTLSEHEGLSISDWLRQAVRKGIAKLSK